MKSHPASLSQKGFWNFCFCGRTSWLAIIHGNGLFDAPSCSLRRLFLSYFGRRRRSNFPLGVKVAFDPRGPAMRKEGIKGGKIDTSVSRFSQRFPFLHSLRRRHFCCQISNQPSIRTSTHPELFRRCPLRNKTVFKIIFSCI